MKEEEFWRSASAKSTHEADEICYNELLSQHKNSFAHRRKTSAEEWNIF